MKKSLAWIGLAGVLVTIGLSIPQVQAVVPNYLKVLGIRSATSVLLRTETSTLSGVTGTGSVEEMSITAALAMTDPAVAPTVASEQSGGSCSTTQKHYFVKFYNPGGATAVSPFVTYTPGSANRRVTLNMPTAPAGATYWTGYWSQAADFSLIRSCTAGSGGITAVGTTTFLCGCSTSGNTTTTSTSSDLKVFSVVDSGIVLPQFSSSAPFTATAGNTRLGFPGNAFGTWATMSSDAGVTNTPLAIDNSKQFCANGCEFEGLVSNGSDFDSVMATYYEAGTTATNRGTITVRPGNSYTSTNSHVRPYVSIDCPVPYSCVLTPATPGAQCIDFIKTGNLERASGFVFDACPSAIWGGSSNAAILRDNAWTGTSIYGVTLGDTNGATGAFTGTFYVSNNHIRATKAAGWRIPQWTGTGWTIVSRDNEFIALQNAVTNADSLVAAWYESTQSANGTDGTWISENDIFSASADSAAYTTYGIRIYPAPGGSSKTKIVLRSPHITVSNTNGSATGNLFGFVVDGSAANAGSTIDIYDPIIDMTSAGSSGTLTGIVVNNASANLTVRVYNPVIIQSGGATRTAITNSANLTVYWTNKEGDLTADTCAIGEIRPDLTTTRELCWCYNNAGAGRWACVSATTTNGPTD